MPSQPFASRRACVSLYAAMAMNPLSSPHKFAKRRCTEPNIYVRAIELLCRRTRVILMIVLASYLGPVS